MVSGGYFLPELAISADCEVTPLIDGAEYGAALQEALDGVGAGGFVYLTGWWLGLARGRFELRAGGRDMELYDAPPYCLNPWPESVPFVDPSDESSALLEVLAGNVRAGTDVRALGWVSPFVLRYPRVAARGGAAHAVAINTLTMRSLEALRETGALAMPSTIGHVAGSTHSKLVLVSDGENTVGFTGGLDLELSRWSRPDHSGRQIWHDVVARVEGPAVQGFYDHFRTLWEANGGELAAAAVPIRPGRGVQRVQNLRTLPAARFPWYLPIRSKPLPEATDGLFTYRDALRHAIGQARRYIYLEDPLMWSVELMTWVRDAVRRTPGLTVILLTGGLDDPNDPPLPHPEYFCQSINHGLLDGLDDGQRSRVRVFRRTGVVVHAKTVLVDDEWACIGSCNLARRSLYTDIEHGVAFDDRVPAYREKLWSHHLGAAPDGELDAWLAAWRGSGQVEEVALPVPEVAFSSRQRRRYQDFHDPDSRWWSPRPF